MTSKTVEYGYVVELLEKLGINPEQVSSIHIDPEYIEVNRFVLDGEGRRLAGSPIAAVGPVIQVDRFAMRSYYSEEVK